MRDKAKRIFIIVCCVVLLTSAFDGHVYAGNSKGMDICAGKTVYVNIDNKAGKEKIYIKEIPRKDCYNDYILYINNVEVKKIKQVQDIYCKIIDIQDKQAGKEIVLMGIKGGVFIGRTLGVYKYRSGKLKKLGGCDYGYFSLITYPIEIKTDGKGKVTFVSDTVIDVGIGSYAGEIDLKLVKDKLKIIKKNEIKINSIASIAGTLKVGKKIKVYKNASNKSTVKKTLSKGERVKILKIKIGKFKKTADKYRPYNASNIYAYIKDSKGKKGWIKVEANTFTEVIYCG